MNSDTAAWGSSTDKHTTQEFKELASLKRRNIALDALRATGHLRTPSSFVQNEVRNIALVAMETKARDLVLALSGPEGFEIPERLEELEKPRRIRGTKLYELASGAEYNVYFHPGSEIVYKIPHQDNWKFWGDREANREAMKEILVLQRKRYEQIDKTKLEKLSAEYAPTYFIAAPDSLGHTVFVIGQPYLSPEKYAPHRLSNQERLLFEEAHVDDLTAANVLRHRPSGKLVLMDCIFATELIGEEHEA